MMNVPKELAEEHYVDLSSKPFYSGLCNYIVRCVALQARLYVMAYGPVLWAEGSSSMHGLYALTAIGRAAV